MRRATIFALTALTAVLLAGGGALADHAPPQCARLFHPANMNDDAEFDREVSAMEACVRNYIGIVPIALRAGRGETVYRVLLHRGERSRPVFVEFVRPRHGAARLTVRTDLTRSSGYAVSVGEAQFAEIEARWAEEPAVRRKAKAAYDAKYHANDGHGIETVCFGWTRDLVEVVRDGNITLQPAEGCESWIFDFPDFLLKQAELASGDCARTTPTTEEGYAIDRCLFARVSPALRNAWSR